MSNLYFDTVNSSKVSHLEGLEKFIDDNQENIPHSIHKELVSLFDDANNEAGNALEEHENQIEELSSEIEELKARIHELEEQQK